MQIPLECRRTDSHCQATVVSAKDEFAPSGPGRISIGDVPSSRYLCSFVFSSVETVQELERLSNAAVPTIYEPTAPSNAMIWGYREMIQVDFVEKKLIAR